MNKQLNREIARFRRPFLAVLLMLMIILVLSPGGVSAGTETWIWIPAADMQVAREGHTASLLSDGRVLVAGGVGSAGELFLKSTELYNPATGTWTSTNNMNNARTEHTATRLPNGLILVAGGSEEPFDLNDPGAELKSAELYDPTTGIWAITGDMNTARAGHTATLLEDGRVLVTGGFDDSRRNNLEIHITLSSTEIYDPSNGSWSPAANMNTPRRYHTATRLRDGRVLVAGGDYDFIAQKSTEIYDPIANTWTTSADMLNPLIEGGKGRAYHTATLLQDGQVLVAGGWDGYDLGWSPYAELFNPQTETWTLTGELDGPRHLHTATLMPDGRVLAVGGWWSEKRVEIYDPDTGNWIPITDLSFGREKHTATLLQDGRVLVAGGYGTDGETFKSAELFEPLCAELPGNIVRNPCFEEGKSPWSFYSNGWAGFNVAEPGYGGVFAAKVEINKEGSNVQLYQSELPLEPNQQYRLFFAAKSNSGHDVSLYLHKHGYPYTNYGLYNEVVNLTPEWQQFTIDFSTNSEAAADGRLRFWLAPYDAAGDEYWFDNVYLVKITDGVPPPPDPNPQEPEVPPEGHCSPPVNGNVIGNPGFEAGTISPWSFYTNGSASRQLSSDRYECKKAFEASIYKAGSNVQLYQAGIALQPNTAYKLRLAAKSTDGRDVRLYLHKHYSPYTNYGLNGLTIDLTDEWQVFVVQFTTTGFTSPVWDGRLRIWLAETDAPGAHYFFDDVVLTPLENNFSTITLTAKKSEGLQSALSLSKISVTPGMATGQLLSSGFFIDDDDAGRANGAFIPSTVRGAPRCDQARPSHAKLWPANGDMVKVKIVGAGKPTDLAVTGIWQDEAVRTEADGVIDRDQVLLRAERDGRNNGRVYHVAFTATYRGGDICRHEILVAVPPDKDMAAVDDGPLADATKP